MASSEASLQELAAQLRRVDNRQQLAELISRYGMAVDDRDFDALGGMFAADGEFHGVHGRQAIIDYYRARTASFSTSSHYAHTWHFEFASDDRATGVVNAHAELCIDGKAVRIALRYLDTYVREGGAWRFLSRQLKFRYVLPFDEVADGIGQPFRVRWPGTAPQAADLPDGLQSYQISRQQPAAAVAPPKE